MTEEEKKSERKHKQAVIRWLEENVSEKLEMLAPILDGTDRRICEYIARCSEDAEGHNLYELLAIKRFLLMLGRHGWNSNRVRKFIKCYEKVFKFSGTHGRTHYELTPIQCFQFANIFGFCDEQGRRLCRTAYIFVPRKFSKTTSTAAVAVYDMLFGDYNAQAFVGANSFTQAKICFDEIRAIMHGLDPREKTFKINREKIVFRGFQKDSSISCVTSNARTQDGLFASLVIMDEYAQARNTAGANGADLRNVLTSSMGPRKEPLTMIITTASDVLDGPFVHELEGVKRVLRGEEDNDLIFASLFMPDVDDEEGDPATWAKVQPHLGITVQSDFYEKEYKNALLSADNMLAFRTKLLNVFAQNELSAWITHEEAQSISRPLEVEKIKGRPDAMLAIDLSEKDDFSAVSFGMWDSRTHGFIFHTAYFFPEKSLGGHPNEQLYRMWAEQGHLQLTKGKVIDYAHIVEYILRVNRYVRILGIGYDPWKSTELLNMLRSSGAGNVLTPVRQFYGNFTSPVQSFEHFTHTGQLHINDNPINFYCFGNAVLDTDTMDNCKPIKRTHNAKIDGVITMLMCMRMLMDYER